MPIAVIIDTITNSIVDVKSNKSVDTDVLPLSRKEAIRIHKKDGWLFSWKSEFGKENRQLYQLVIKGTKRIHGLLSVEVMGTHIEMHLIENAPHNLGKGKEYAGAATNLVAFACKLSFGLGFEGYISFQPKTQLFEHYKETLGAERISKSRMQIPTESAKKLVNSYYKNYKL